MDSVYVDNLKQNKTPSDLTASESCKDFDYEMSVRGWTIFPGVVSEDLCNRMRDDISQHVGRCGDLQLKAGISGAPDGTAHHTVGFGDSLDEFLKSGFLANYIEQFFGGPYILHAFNPLINSPGKQNYAHRIHKDVRTHTGSFRMLLNLLVMVDEFTLENGATHILSGSHKDPALPPETFFFRHAERITGAKGSIVFFDSGLWHAAGKNVSALPRTALTMSLSRPFLKPQMDYARYLGDKYGEGLSEELRQLLGYNACVATSLDEWYQPADSRMYHSDQG